MWKMFKDGIYLSMHPVGRYPQGDIDMGHFLKKWVDDYENPERGLVRQGDESVGTGMVGVLLRRDEASDSCGPDERDHRRCGSRRWSRFGDCAQFAADSVVKAKTLDQAGALKKVAKSPRAGPLTVKPLSILAEDDASRPWMMIVKTDPRGFVPVRPARHRGDAAAGRSRFCGAVVSHGFLLWYR